MELLHLKYFKYVAEYLNYTIAAQKLCVSQPALSMTIKKLESELNTQLFVKEGRNIQLTENGKILLSSVNNIIDEINQVTNLLAENEKIKEQTIRFATSNSRFMQPIFDKFLEQYPDKKFNLEIATNIEMIQRLLSQQIHFTLNSMKLTHPNISCKKIINENIVLTYPKYLDGEDIDMRDPSLYKSFLFSSHNTEFNRKYKEVLKYKNIAIDNANYVDDYFMSALLEKRNFFSFLPVSMCKELHLPYINKEEYIFSHPIYLSTLTNSILNEADKDFYYYIEQFLIEHQSYFNI